MSSPSFGTAVLDTDLNLPGLRRGKVRDVYSLPEADGSPSAEGSRRADPRLLIIATDRISAFDVVMPTPIAGKGRLLTRLSAFWFEFIRSRSLCSTHLLGLDAADIPASAFRAPAGSATRTTREDLIGRVMCCRRARVVPIECVVRGYLEGSGWREYQQTGAVCGVALPPGLRQCDALPEPIFTPATKEDGGKHDENITFEQASALVGNSLMEALRSVSLRIYAAAAAYALERGIIVADTKFEFGLPLDPGGEPIAGAAPMLIDEALTPDSSRFWPAAQYAPGRAQQSFDKQFLREYLETLVAAGRWDKRPPGPVLPDEIVSATRARYQEAVTRLGA